MTPDEARTLLERTLLEVVPDADVTALSGDADFREELELDSLDFVTFVERLSKAAATRIDEDDYRRLRTLDQAAQFLASRTATAR